MILQTFDLVFILDLKQIYNLFPYIAPSEIFKIFLIQFKIKSKDRIKCIVNVAHYQIV